MPRYRRTSPQARDAEHRAIDAEPFAADCIEDALQFAIAHIEPWPHLFNAAPGDDRVVTVVDHDRPGRSRDGRALFLGRD